MRPASPRFLETLKNKLSFGSTRSILLNCLPARSASRLAINDIDLLKKDFSSSFVEQLCTVPDFDIKIPVTFKTPKTTDAPHVKQAIEEENTKKSKIERKLVNIKYDHDDILKEQGIETFGFGFPILVRRDPSDPTSIIVAPLLIWPLDLKQEFDRSKTWTISRKSEKGIQVNEALRAFLKSEQQVEMPSLPESVTDDGLVDKTELETFIQSLKEKLYISNSGMHQWNYLDVIPERIDLQKEILGQSRIIFSGVFGIYKSQKQSLINDLSEMIRMMESSTDNDNGDTSFPLEWSHATTPIQVDPSQHTVLRSLIKKDKIVIQGPPGTGKSQTLTAIIAAALSDRKKVLVVCEKRTALEVIRQNMVKRYPFLDRSIALIEDVASDRNTLVKKARERETQPEKVKMAMGMVADFKRQNAQFESLIAATDERYTQLLEPITADQRWMDAVAEWLSLEVHSEQLPELEWMAEKVSKLDIPGDYTTVGSELAVLNKLHDLTAAKRSTFLRLFNPLLSPQILLAVPKKVRSLSFEISLVLKDLEQLLSNCLQNINQFAHLETDALLQLANELSNHIKTTSTDLADPSRVSLIEHIVLLFNKNRSKILFASKEVKRLQDVIQEKYNAITGSENTITEATLLADKIKTEKESLTKLIIDTECSINALNDKHASPEEITAWEKSNEAWQSICNELREIYPSTVADCSRLPLREKQNCWHALRDFINAQLGDETAVLHYINWKVAFLKSPDFMKELVNLFNARQTQDWSRTWRTIELYTLLSTTYQEKNYPENDHHLHQILLLWQDMNRKQDVMIHDNIHVWFNDGLMKYEQSKLGFRKLFNLRGNNGESRNSLRRIIHQHPEAFTDMHPLVLANPTAVSTLFPLVNNLFDLVIFDEASQLRIEDTFSSLLRGKAAIVSGDSQQMPPSSYFESSMSILQPSADEDEYEDDQEKLMEDLELEMANRESLLEWAIDEGYEQTYLDMHYRSRHPDLIEFSNTCFYGSRLIPMPGSVESAPINFTQVNGLYESRMNLKEAQEVIRILREEIPSGKTVGIATFNLVQRNLILDLINKLRYEDGRFHEQMTALDQLGFFVKNLENIQGDERDIIIISTTFGLRKDGSFKMAFGPIGQKNGYRLLNVIITRAREKIYMLTSIPTERQQEFRQYLESDKRVSGKTGLLAYLIYCRLVSAGNHDAKLDLLKEIRNNIAGNNEATQRKETEAPFEQQVAQCISKNYGDDSVSMKHPCGGFIIDIQFTHPETGKRFAIATDGSAYHSDVLFWHNDAYRQEQLEKEGYHFIRLWSAAWWSNRMGEEQKLMEELAGG
jgi:hypothetical protein